MTSERKRFTDPQQATGAEEQGSRSAQRDFVLTKEVAIVSQRS